ncbi:hypothetical protein MKW94_029057 [Papaver nudicaule]|uniref:VWA-Hint protein Vwaint domain-containing protein n=1 Tax=Papaver nudicaule TaxID=74823 RepID=A0AA41UXA8_PAPNU|nr:hypothetical protein [Papaver nudicaule]
MLLSDGQDNYAKAIDLQDISRLQIPVYTFGFGADHDSGMLNSISEGSKGTFSFIEDVGVVQDAFAQCIGGLLSVAVQDVQVHIQSFDPNICLSQLKAGGYSTNLAGDKKTGSVDLGDMYADEERDFLVLVNIPVVADGSSSDHMKLVSVRQKNRLQAAEAMSNSRAAAESGDLPRARSILSGCVMQMADTVSMQARDQFTFDLASDLEGVQQRMATPAMYASAGRPQLLAGMSSHSTQKAVFGGAAFKYILHEGYGSTIS